MRKILLALALGGLAGCSTQSEPAEQIAESTSQALNGELFTGGNLTRKSNTYTETLEANRQQNTSDYYKGIGIAANGGTSLGNVKDNLPTLGDFISFYGIGFSTTAKYYNRGDLGIGRQMNCIDRFSLDGQIVCFVRNYAAGDGGTEFQFGESSNIAFANMTANNPFATVAMVFRDQATTNKVYFAVYDQAGNLSNVAPLDRHGLLFQNEFAVSGGANPPASFGTPGQNFNNHIPSNCLSCHGASGSFDPGTPPSIPVSSTGGVFLPFDLDQFDYDASAGADRAAQLSSFKTLNEMVRKVASFAPNGANVKNILDTWYANTNHTGQTDSTEVFENSFDGGNIPTAWQGAADAAIYSSVVRRSCRTCHVTSSNYPFNTPTEFRNLASAAVLDLQSRAMPHSLQVTREFWLSDAPIQLENYLGGTAASTLHALGPGNVVTIDPPLLAHFVRQL